MKTDISCITPRPIVVRGKQYSFERPKVMTIINATPDSFYSGSRTPGLEALRERIRSARDLGTDILDIGGYSTRPGAPEISPEEEWDRLAPALEAAREIAPEIPVSVDTFRASVARKCVVEGGADIINDISGGDLDPEMFHTVAELKTPYILMHTRGTPATMQQLTDYDDVTADVLRDLEAKCARLERLGVYDIILDPGFGFAKTAEQNYQLLAELEAFTRTGRPVLAGMSRKSMIWRPLGITPEEALPGTIALHTAALMKGAAIVRVHDTEESVQMLRCFLGFSRL